MEVYAQLNSGIYIGQVRHRRFTPKSHEFNYKLYMLALDLDELDDVAKVSPWLGTSKFSPIKINPADYLKQERGESLKQRVCNKAKELGLAQEVDRVLMVAQVRCFGLYFSPINLFYCYHDGECVSLLAEVSNTPWNQRHYYLIPMANGRAQNQKDFHVSPFMQLDMMYHWRLKAPNKRLMLHIENHQQNESAEKVFDATLSLQKQPLTASNVLHLLRQFPMMTATVVIGIYWQALKLFIKRVPFVAHPNS